VNQVDKKIKRNGNQVPMILVNISILLIIINATKKKSIPIINNTKMTAVCIGDVKLNFLKYIIEMIVKNTGARIK